MIVAGHWGAHGLALMAAFFASFAAVALLYVACVLRLTFAPVEPSALRRTLVLVSLASVLLAAAAWRAPVLFSADVYAYAFYGELGNAGADPYNPPNVRRPATALDREVLRYWGPEPPPSVYGPGFVALARGVDALLGRRGPAAVVAAFRALALAAFAGCCALMLVLTRGRPPGERAAAFALLALNPALVWSAAEGHNDPLMLLAALGGLALVRARRWLPAACALALAPLIKLPGALGLLGALPALRQRAFAAAYGALAAAGAAAYALALRPEAARGGSGFFHPQFSLQGAGALVGDLLAPGGAGHAWGGALGLLPGALVALAGGWRVLRGRRAAFAQLAVGAWLLVPNPYPWYGFWFVPVAAVAPGSPWAGALAGLSLASVMHYLPDVTDDAVVIWVLAGTQVAAVALAVAAWLACNTFVKRP